MPNPLNRRSRRAGTARSTLSRPSQPHATEPAPAGLVGDISPEKGPTPPSPALPVLVAGARPRPIVPATMAEAMELARAVVAARLAPRGLDTPEACMIAILHGLEVGLTPLAALQRIAVIDGRPTIWGDGALALVRASGLLRSIDESLAGQEANLTATCTVERRGDPGPLTRCFGADDARRAGLWARPGPWRDYPGRMLQMRARAFALRDAFPDVLGGLYLREEIEEPPRAPPPDGPVGAPAPQGAPDLSPQPSSAGAGREGEGEQSQDPVPVASGVHPAGSRGRTGPDLPSCAAARPLAVTPQPRPAEAPAQPAPSTSKATRTADGAARTAQPKRRAAPALRRSLAGGRRAAAGRRVAGWHRLGGIAGRVVADLTPNSSARTRRRRTDTAAERPVTPGCAPGPVAPAGPTLPSRPVSPTDQAEWSPPRGRGRPRVKGQERARRRAPAHEDAAPQTEACLPAARSPVPLAPSRPLGGTGTPAHAAGPGWSPPRDILADFDLALCCARDHQTLQEIEDEFILALERLSSDEREQAQVMLSRHRARITRLDTGELA